LYRIGINTRKNYLAAMGRRAPDHTEIDSEEAEGFEDGDQLRDLNTPENQMMSRQGRGDSEPNAGIVARRATVGNHPQGNRGSQL
jgi:hypothetical protein